jgi:hypothetical protein
MLFNPHTPLEILDNKQVNYATPNSEAGLTCNTCAFYYLPLPPDADVQEVYRDFTVDDLVRLIKVNTPIGACSYHTSKNKLLVNVDANCCCKHHVKKPLNMQFEDNAIKE